MCRQLWDQNYEDLNARDGFSFHARLRYVKALSRIQKLIAAICSEMKFMDLGKKLNCMLAEVH